LRKDEGFVAFGQQGFNGFEQKLKFSQQFPV
jgi:hypothetical protein